MLQRAAYTRNSWSFFERLQNVVVRAAPDRFQRRGNIVYRRNHNYGHVRVVFAHPVQQLYAVHFRHDHVAEHEVRRDALYVVLRSPAVVHR